MLKQYKTKDGFYKGQMSDAIAALNAVVEVADNEEVYVTADNETIVSDAPIEGAALLSERPDAEHTNVGGKWVKLEARPEAVTPPVDVAFMRLIGAYSVAGSYPNKQSAMKKAVESLGEDATADELYTAAVEALSA